MKRLLCLVGMMDTGGAETFLMKLYRVLDTDKYQMDFCVNVERKCFYDDEITERGGKIFHIPSKTENPLEFRKQLKNIVLKNKYEYVLKITSNCIGFLDVKIAKRAGARVCAVRSSNSSDGDSILIHISHWLGRMLYKKYVDIKIAPSRKAAMYTFGLKDVNNNSVAILHNGVNLDYYKYSLSDRKRIREEYHISEDVFLIGHIGRFSVQKNHEFLINIFDSVRNIKENCKLLLVGSGDLEASIMNKVEKLGISDDIIFVGIRSDIPALLSAMDVFVFPSLYEGMPNTVIEAQATGLPCIISDTITSESIINDNVIQLSLDNANDWIQAIIQVNNCADRSDQKKMIDAHYDIHDVVNDFTTIVFGD